MSLDKLKIIRLEAENVKRLVAVDIRPNGDVVEITGKNGHGKTSVLDSILWAMAGERQIQWEPIRAGEEKAIIRLSLGDEKGDLQLLVTRTFKAKEDGFTTSLRVVNADGFEPKGAQTLLNQIVGALSFDPGEFVRAKPGDQIGILKDVIRQLDPEADFDSIAKDRKAAFDERTDTNREAARERSRATTYVFAEDTPAEQRDTAALTKKMAEATEAARTHHALVRERDRLYLQLSSLEEDYSEADDRVAALRREADELEAATKEGREALAKSRAEFEALPELVEPESTESIVAELEAIHRENAAVSVRQNHEAAIKSAEALEAKSKKLTERIEALDQKARDLVEAADLPVSGLEIRPEAVFLRGVPFNQASDAEQLRASMAIGMAANPRLRVIRVRDGSLLDEDAMEVVREVAAETGFQIWMERVGAGGDGAIVMENGNVKL